MVIHTILLGIRDQRQQYWVRNLGQALRAATLCSCLSGVAKLYFGRISVRNERRHYMEATMENPIVARRPPCLHTLHSRT